MSLLLWAAGSGAVVAGVWALARLLKPLPDDGKRNCPHCGHSFAGERRYCLACGGQIWDDVLSEKK